MLSRSGRSSRIGRAIHFARRTLHTGRRDYHSNQNRRPLVSRFRSRILLRRNSSPKSDLPAWFGRLHWHHQDLSNEGTAPHRHRCPRDRLCDPPTATLFQGAEGGMSIVPGTARSTPCACYFPADTWHSALWEASDTNE